MIYDVRQVTTYTYGSFVPFASHLLRLSPKSSDEVEVLKFDIKIDPAPQEVQNGIDFFGNGTTLVTLKQPHNRFTIETRAIVRLLETSDAAPEATLPWEDVREQAHLSSSIDPRSPAHQLFPTRHIGISSELLDYATESFTECRPILEAAIDLMTRIKTEFIYDPMATNAQTSAFEAFAKRRGVCQDFAHVMIGAMRSLGLPAAYVSGYLRTHPAPGRQRLEGADAMHAWVSVWCGEKVGWVGLDPTNAIRAEQDHIPLSFGRDYSDVSPIDGIIFDSGSHSLSVAVDVIDRTGRPD